MRKLLAAMAALVLLATVALVLAVRHAEVGYLSPQFTPDGSAIVVLERDARALVLGFGYEMLTPPAHVRVTRDRFSIVRVSLGDGRREILQQFPPSPIEGAWINTYRPSLYGSVSGHLRWATPDALEYEVSVTIHRQPTSETFVTRRQWDTEKHAWIESTPWEKGYGGMGGDESTQLHGHREVLAVRAGSALPCAVVIVTTGEAKARPILESSQCRKAHPDGYPVAELADVLRRADIERIAMLSRTHDELVAAARARGLSEGAAALDAIRGMQKLGLYPKPSTIVATRADAAPAGVPVFAITDMEFRVGIFNDIREAIDRPGEEVEKATGAYVIHRDYDASRQINQYLADRRDTDLYVHADGVLWRLAVDFR